MSMKKTGHVLCLTQTCNVCFCVTCEMVVPFIRFLPRGGSAVNFEFLGSEKEQYLL